MFEQKLLKVRYAKPLLALKDDYLTKTVLSILASIGAFLYDIFYVQPELIALLSFAIFADFVTGVIASKRNKVPIRSLGFRQMAVKVIEYTFFLLILTGVSNVFGKTESTGWVATVVSAVNNIDIFGYLYLILTELKSVAENIAGKKGELAKLLEKIKQKVLK